MKLGIVAFAGICLCGIPNLNAQTTPGEIEDARAEQLKILRAADKIDIIESSSEKLRTDVDGLKEQVAKLQDTNTALQQQISALKSALEKSEDARVKEREVLLTKVGEMIASSKPPPDTKKESAPSPANHDTEHGYNHTVEKGQTLSMIAAAYTEKGVKVTVDDIRKANNLGPKDVIKPGQVLFIPKK